MVGAAPLFDVEPLWLESHGDPEICVAFLDGPADLSHSCFAGANIVELTPAWLQDRRRSNSSAHGTHVASIVLGQHGGPVRGIAPRCRAIVIPIYVEEEVGKLANCSQIDLARAISLARSEGAHIINISGGQLTPTGEADPFLADAVVKCAQQGTLIVAATGNNGCECLHVPAALPTVLAVGASDAEGRVLQFSNWGAPLEQNGILAPGDSIPGAGPDNSTVARTGTSFAAPYVTGVAALLLSIQKLHGQRPDPGRVRAAMLESAHACPAGMGGEQCDRMLAGLLNPLGARNYLVANDEPVPYDAPLPKVSIGLSSGVAAHEFDKKQGRSPIVTAQPQTAAMVTPSAGDQIAQLQALVTQLQGLVGQQVTPSALAEALPASRAVDAPSPAPITPVLIPAEPKVSPSDCGCGGAHARVGLSEATVGGIPENDFVTFRNSQLVYAIGELGYDFGTEARRDYFVQRFQSVFRNDFLRKEANVSEGNIPLPENYKAMAVYLMAADILEAAEKPEAGDYADTKADANALIWTLTIDAVPVYEIRPMGNFDLLIFIALLDFLKDIADRNVERISVAGRIVGSKRLYNGSVVPTIEPTLRGMASWEAGALIDHLLKIFKENPEKLRTIQGEGEDELRSRLRNFLNRIYYALRNLGQTPDDRAINFLATNLYDAGEVFIEAAKEKYELDTIAAERSAICRPDSLCFDVVMTFFDPTQRQDRARKQYRRTVDVSDIVPVNVGALRSWYVY